MSSFFDLKIHFFVETFEFSYVTKSERFKGFLSTYELVGLKKSWSTYHLERSERLKKSGSTLHLVRSERMRNHDER